MSKGVLLINVGTPEAPTKKGVRRFLFQFLNDKLVIDLPLLLRLFLVNCIIIPFRINKSTSLYKRLWTEKGSPILIYLESLRDKLNAVSGEKYKVYTAMRYGKPLLKNVLSAIANDGVKDLKVVPLYPQYATSTTQTTINKVSELIDSSINVSYVEQFYDDKAFVDAFANRVKTYKPDEFDHIIFTYHGLPDRQINKIHKGCSCTELRYEAGIKCYKASCFDTSKLLAASLGLNSDKYTTGFQSRLSKNWATPFTDELISRKLDEGCKRILIVSPSFVADCLETIVEIDDYRQEFLSKGGEKLALVESLNDSDIWVKALNEIICS